MITGKENIYSVWFHFGNFPTELMESQSLEIFHNTSGHGPVQLRISSKASLPWAWDRPVLEGCLPAEISNDMTKLCSHDMLTDS